jgi:hypothetical protein
VDGGVRGDVPVDFWGKFSTATHNLAMEGKETVRCSVDGRWPACSRSGFVMATGRGRGSLKIVEVEVRTGRF